MSKFLYLTDTQIKGVTPATRKDNYFEACLEKLQESCNIAKEFGCDRILHGGDFWDSPIVSYNVLDKVLDLIERNGLIWHIVWGNHDLVGHNIKTSDSSALSHMFRRSDFVKPAMNAASTLIDNLNYEIVSRNYYHNIEADIKDVGLMGEHQEESIWKIGMAHAMLVEKPLPDYVLHIPVNELKTNCGLVLCSHNHNPFELKIQGTFFVNPGCFGRTGTDEAHICPSVVLVDTDKRTYRIMKLKSAKKGSKIFDLTQKAEEKNIKVDLDNFVEAIKNTKHQSLDARGNVEYYSKQGNVERKITDLVINKIGQVEAEK